MFVFFILFFYKDSSFSSASSFASNEFAFSLSEFCGVCTDVGNGVDGNFGGDDAGVLNVLTVVICSKNVSSCFSDSALCSVSNGRMGGTPPKPSRTRNRALLIQRWCILKLVYRAFGSCVN